MTISLTMPNNALTPLNLFEYQNTVGYSKMNEHFVKDDFIAFLDKIWQEREKNPYFRDIPSEEQESEFDEEIKKQQQFITFQDNFIKSRKYIGVIHFDGITFNLLPKIFYDKDIPADIELIQKNILWWLAYSKRLKLPKLLSQFNKIKCNNFLELLIYYFASYTRDLLTRMVYQTYNEIDREIFFVKGRLNINEYIKENLCTGNWAKINCTYDSFEIDNLLNRIIKYVSKLLIPFTKVSQNDLREIAFALDEVSDGRFTATDCKNVKINPLFSEMQTVLDYCKLFLSHSTVYTYKNELKVFAFLLPMEKVFEEFISGFIENHKSEIFKNLIEEIEVKTQSNMDKYLDQKKRVFKLLHDILILDKNRNVQFIVDAKYKLIYSKVTNSEDFKPSQGDMYQMVSYAIRQNCTSIKLFYPQHFSDTFQNNGEPIRKYNIKDEIGQKNVDIEVNVYKLPVTFEEGKDKEKEKNLIIILHNIFNSKT